MEPGQAINQGVVILATLSFNITSCREKEENKGAKRMRVDKAGFSSYNNVILSAQYTNCLLANTGKFKEHTASIDFNDFL